MGTPLRVLGENRVPGNRLQSNRWVWAGEKARLGGRVRLGAQIGAIREMQENRKSGAKEGQVSREETCPFLFSLMAGGVDDGTRE